MSMIITAKDNDKIKYTKSLLKSKNRNKESKFIIEGYRILTLAIECNAKLDYVFINEDFEKKEEHREFLEVLKKKLGPEAAKRLSIQRYKGLGEMDFHQLWETTMDPTKRKMIRVSMEDAMEADKIFSDLMGDNVDPRKEYIRENAKFVKNLDLQA